MTNQTTCEPSDLCAYTNYATYANIHLAEYLHNSVTVSDGENGWETLRLPFLDRFNDHIELSIKTEGNIVAISDDFQYIDDYGMDALETSIKIAERHGLKVLRDEDNRFELCYTFDINKDDYGKVLLNFITAILKMQGLGYVHRSYDKNEPPSVIYRRVYAVEKKKDLTEKKKIKMLSF